MSPPPLKVVAGLLRNPAQPARVLLTRRPLAKVRGGWWEFPGGKVQPHEPLQAAIVRELSEELGIELPRSKVQLRLRLRQTYPDLTIDLHLMEAADWHGRLQAREVSEWRWLSPADALQGDLPVCAADAQLLLRLQWPSVYRITPDVPIEHPHWLRCWQMLLGEPAGASLCLWRLPSWPAYQRAVTLHALLEKRPDWRPHLLISRDVDLALAMGTGVQLAAGQLADPPSGWDRVLGWRAASAHTPAELAQAAALGCDFATLSPVMPTATHPAADSLGWARFADWTLDQPLPVYALGGVGPPQLAQALAQGAVGVAGIRACW